MYLRATWIGVSPRGKESSQIRIKSSEHVMQFIFTSYSSSTNTFFLFIAFHSLLSYWVTNLKFIKNIPENALRTKMPTLSTRHWIVRHKRMWPLKLFLLHLMQKKPFQNLRVHGIQKVHLWNTQETRNQKTIILPIWGTSRKYLQ